MNEVEQRARVVSVARSWCGTPYRHHQGAKKIGVDCGYLLIKVFAEAGLIDDFDPGAYSKTWFLHRDEERYLGFVARFCGEIDERHVAPGDVVLWKIGRLFAHGGIVTAWPKVIHAYGPAGLVLESDTSVLGEHTLAPRRFFSYWGAVDGVRESQ